MLSAKDIVKKSTRAARAVARDRARYPALRLRPTTELVTAHALAAVGFGQREIELAEREYERAADRLFPLLLARAGAVGADRYAAKLARRKLPGHESKKILYLLVRLLAPTTVVETGTFNGTLSTFMLAGLEDNGHGRLLSLDLPAYQPIPNAIADRLPPGHEPGWLIPEELRERFELVIGDARLTLGPTLERVGKIELFLHDSLHTTKHMLFEYRLAWRHLGPGGVLVSDDVFATPAFWWFTRIRRLPFVHTGMMGLVRRPALG